MTRLPRPPRLPSLLAAIATALSLAAGAAHADIVVGGDGFTTPARAIRYYADDANGDVPPVSVLQGPATAFQGTSGLAFDDDADEMFVADFGAQRIFVFAESARGDVAPIRTMQSAQLGQPRGVTLAPAHGEMFTVAQLCCVTAFPITADGATARLRVIAGAATLQNNPVHALYLPSRDEIAVADFQQDGAQVDGEVLFFARTASGDVAPLRRIVGAATALGNNTVWGIAADEARNELYAIADVPDQVNERRIVVHAIDASGNAMPLRVIEGAATLLTLARDVAFDRDRDELLVSTLSGAGVTRIVAFPRLASGNVAPSRVITGSQVGAGGTGALAYHSRDGLFLDGFE